MMDWATQGSVRLLHLFTSISIGLVYTYSRKLTLKRTFVSVMLTKCDVRNCRIVVMWTCEHLNIDLDGQFAFRVATGVPVVEFYPEGSV